MATRRVLHGIANELAVSFVGRNNDMDGYWAVGLLRSFADQARIREIHFDLLKATARPAAGLPERVAAAYAGRLRTRLANVRLPLDRVRRAEVTVAFGQYDGNSPPPQVTRGEPFKCAIVLEDDRGRTYERTLSSWCAPHDASREWRRAPEHRGLAG